MNGGSELWWEVGWLFNGVWTIKTLLWHQSKERCTGLCSTVSDVKTFQQLSLMDDHKLFRAGGVVAFHRVRWSFCETTGFLLGGEFPEGSTGLSCLVCSTSLWNKQSNRLLKEGYTLQEVSVTVCKQFKRGPPPWTSSLDLLHGPPPWSTWAALLLRTQAIKVGSWLHLLYWKSRYFSTLS